MKALPRDAPWHVDEGIPASLPLLQEFVSDFRDSLVDLRQCAAVLVQHQLGSMIPLLEALFALGLHPEKTHWIDVPYSSNLVVRNAVGALGVPSHNFAPSKFVFGDDLAEYQISRVRRSVEKAGRQAPGSLLVLDDGAYALQALALSGQIPMDLRIIEQTARGMTLLRTNSSLHRLAESVTVVDVAESIPKKQLEPRYIARSILLSIISRVSEHLQFQQANILVLGFGSIGQAVCQELRTWGVPPSNVLVVDPHPPRQVLARSEGFKAFGELSVHKIRGVHLIFGCSGTLSFQASNISSLAATAYLASASSGQYEFPILELLSLGKNPMDADRIGIHDDLSIDFGDGRRIVVMNGGFPANFDGKVNNLPPQFAQFTRVLMLAAAVQAMSTGKVGIQPLAAATSTWVLQKHESYFGHI